MRKAFLYALLLSIFFGNLSCALKQGTYVALQDNRSERVEKLRESRNVLSYCGKKYGLYYTPLIYKAMFRHELEVFIVTEYGGKILATPGQHFYDIISSKYVQAKDLTKQHLLMDKKGRPVKIKLVRTRATRLSDKFYSLSTFEPNTFFILDSSGHTILCHNVILECILAAEKIYEVASWVSVGITVANVTGLTNAIVDSFKGGRKVARERRRSRRQMEHLSGQPCSEEIPPSWLNPEDGKVYPGTPDTIPDFIIKNCKSKKDGKLGKEAFEEFKKTLGSGSGGPNGDDPEKLWEKFKKYLRNKNVLPHIFRDKDGHILEPSEDILKRFIENIKPKNRTREQIFNNGKSKVETFKSRWGRIGEIWSRTGKLDNAGINFFDSLENVLEKMKKINEMSEKLRGNK
ncbi:hypothetical protein ACFLYH_02540 [Candidatus Dependentiae bacterium]